MSGFWAMGDYAVYVWPAYGISAMGVLVAAALVLRAHARAKAALVRLGVKP
jgi:heme exporter protein CcmD